MRKMRLTVALALVALSAPLPAAAGVQVGEKAPAFSIRDLYHDGRVVDSAKAVAGKTTLLSFFATWCKPCLLEIPQFQDLAQRYREKGFQVILISLDRGGDAEIRDFLDRAGVAGLEVLWDEDGEAMAAYQVFGLPTNVLVDPGGLVSMAWQGYQPNRIDDLAALLEKLPGKPASPK